MWIIDFFFLAALNVRSLRQDLQAAFLVVHTLDWQLQHCHVFLAEHSRKYDVITVKSTATERPHCNRETWKRSFIFMFRSSVHTNPSRKFELFRKRSSNRRNLKTPGFWFRMEGKHFENDGVKIIRCYSLNQVFLTHKSKMAGDSCVFKFLYCGVDGKHLIRFQSETSVLKFLRRRVD